MNACLTILISDRWSNVKAVGKVSNRSGGVDKHLFFEVVLKNTCKYLKRHTKQRSVKIRSDCVNNRGSTILKLVREGIPVFGKDFF